MIEQVPEFLKGFLLGLPVWGILGWLLSRTLGPFVDELGISLKKWVFASLVVDEYATYVGYTEIEKVLSKLHTERGHKRFDFKNNHNINLTIKRFNTKQLQGIAKTWIQHAHIGNYSESNIFFAGMELLVAHLTKEDIDLIVSKHSENDQAIVWPFLETIESIRPELLSASTLSYLRTEQEKYEAKLAKPH